MTIYNGPETIRTKNYQKTPEMCCIYYTYLFVMNKKYRGSVQG